MMLSNRVKYSLSWFFLAAFMLVKVSALHGIVHKDDVKDSKDCVWCHLSGTDNNTPFIAAEEAFELQEIPSQEYNIVINNYTSLATEKTPVCLIFNKPPPFYIV